MIIDSKELLYILRRALNTIPFQDAPAWASELCEACEHTEDWSAPEYQVIVKSDKWRLSNEALG